METNTTIDDISVNLSKEQENFIDLFRSGKNIVLSAAAGSGKSFVLNHIRNNILSDEDKCSVVFTSSTAISALLINGVTAHSYLGIGIGEGDYKNWIRYTNRFNIRARGDYLSTLKTLIIDEFSMLNSQFIDNLDLFLRLKKNKTYNSKPFGGVQIILIGDIFQLDNVSGNSITESDIFKDGWKFITFVESHRQKCKIFQKMLEDIKFNSSFDLLLENIEIINSVHEVETDEGVNKLEDFTLLVSTNEEVEKYNNYMIKKLGFVNMKTFKPIVYNKTNSKYLSKFHIFDLSLCVGCKVLITFNISPELCNGRSCIIRNLDGDSIGVSLWEDFKINGELAQIHTITYIDRIEDSVVMSEGKGKIKQTKLFSYIPLKIGYAITVHKSQGATLDKVLLDIDRVFNLSQLYVAVGRVRNVNDIIIISKYKKELKENLLYISNRSEYNINQKKKFYSRFIVSMFTNQI
jgi:ATP-dependent DNA helicase PIF1